MKTLRPTAIATVVAMAWLFASELSPAVAAEEQTDSTWISVAVRNAATAESEIIDEATGRPKARAAPSRPFTVEVPIDWPCQLDYVYPNGIGRDRDFGLLHFVFLVAPPPASQPGGRWTKTQIGPKVCKPAPVPREATARTPAGATLRRVSELAILPAPTIGISPASEGITGAPVRLWAAGIPEAWVALPAAALDGKRIEIEARPSAFAWDAGDTGTAAPRSTYETPNAGNPSSPAVEHVYETKSSVGRPGEGVYTISVAVTWERRYRVVGVADPCNDWCDLGPGGTSTSMPYRVGEVRAVLVP